jgi:hypothetical protein
MVEVKIAEKLILRVRALTSLEAIVDHLDLFPVGLPIAGGPNSLHLSGTTLVGNTFRNLRVAFAISLGKRLEEGGGVL